MLVVFDTSIWISDLALTSSAGSAIRFYLRQRDARIGLPEVVKLETEFQLRTTLARHIDQIQSSHRQLLAVFGQLKEVVLPTVDEVEALISRVFGSVGVNIEDIPFTLESAKGSLVRAVQKLPPSDKDQQFKDGVLWEDCLKLLAQDDVILVTSDKAFYKNRDIRLGLADELGRDISSAQNVFKIFPSLSELLSEIRTDVPIDSRLLIATYLQQHGERVHEMASKHSFVLAGEQTAQIELFVTERPAFLYMTLTLELPCVDATDQGRTGAKFVIRGEGTFNADAKAFIDLANRGERLLFQWPDGTEKTLENIVIAVGSAVIGHRTVEHSVRRRI